MPSLHDVRDAWIAPSDPRECHPVERPLRAGTAGLCVGDLRRSGDGSMGAATIKPPFALGREAVAAPLAGGCGLQACGPGGGILAEG